MSVNDAWVLPDGVGELSPEQAIPLEQLRRKILDLFHSWGYELVTPPLFEFLDSLLTGSGHELALETIKITDQVTGKMMGLRADMTPQVARMEARERQKDVPDRLCYVGHVGKARMQETYANRSPIQIGAELFGHAGVESDSEVVQLMLATLQAATTKKVTLDLGHVGIFRSLVQQAELDEEQEAQLVEALQRKSVVDVQQLLEDMQISASIAKMIQSLISLHGAEDVLTQARKVLDMSIPAIAEAVESLEALAEAIVKQNNAPMIHFDLSELRGYKYHTGLVFAAYVEGIGVSVAKGGRYDAIGQAFGRARPATGFSADVLNLTLLSQTQYQPDKILAPAEAFERVVQLRQEGHVVVTLLPGQKEDAAAMGCTQKLVQKGDDWQLVPCKK